MQGSGRNLMRAAVCAATIVLLFGISSCEQFTANIEEDFSYWASEPAITGFRSASPAQTNPAGVQCVPSASDAVITLTVHNPKNFSFIMPDSSGTPADIVTFGSGIHDASGTNPPAVNADYTLVQSTRDTLTLTYKSAFLKRYEHGSDNIGAAITLYSTDGRKFNQIYKFNLDANTPPPKPTAVLAQTNSASPTYVLCLQVPDMGVSVTGGLLHKDIAQIEINGTSYPLTVSGTTTDFVKPADAHFITAVTQLVGYPAPPAGAWVLYYDTGLPVGNAYQAYTVKLKDNKGLVSAVLETGTARPQPPAETVTIARGQQGAGSGSGTSVGSPIIINGETSAPEAQITIQNIAGTTVHCTVQEVVGGSATGAVSPYDGNPVTASLGLGTATEKLYEVKYHTDGTGYTPTSTTTKYYKVLKCHSVTFDANGGTFTDGSTTSTSRTVLVPHNTQAAAPVAPNVPTRAGYTLGSSWYTEAGCTTQWNFTTPITANITLYAKWAPNSGTSYRVEHYQELSAAPAGQYPTSPQETENPTGTTGAHITGIYKNYQGFEFASQDPPSATIAADGNTVVKVYYKRKTVNVTFNPNGGTISGSTSNVTLSGRFGTSLTVPANPVKTGYTFNTWSPPYGSPALSSPPTFPASDTMYTAYWTANTYTVRFNGNGHTGGNMGNQTFTYNVPQNLTANAFTKTGHTFAGWATSSGSTTVAHANGAAVNNLTDTQGGTVDLYAVWTEDHYTVQFCVESGTGTLTAQITGGTSGTSNNSTLQTLASNITYGKTVTFTAAPELAWEVDGWTGITASPSSTTATLTVTGNTTVKVKFKKTTTIKSTDPQPWKLLKRAVEIADNNAVIAINGEIKATNVGSNSGQILIKKNITIQGSNNTTDILNANSGGTDAPSTTHRIFIVQSGKTLTLKNLTLKDGEGAAGTKGGAIYLLSGSSEAELEGCIIEDCKADYGGAIGCNKSSTVKLTNTTIKNCTAHTGANTGTGGAIYAEGATVEMTGCTLTGNKADKGGGAIYAVKNGSTPSAVTISGGTIGGTDTNDANKATGTGADEGQGGGIWVGDACSLNLKDSTDPSSGVQSLQILGNRAQKGQGIYAKNTIVSMKDTLQINANNDVYLDDGTKIRADSNLNPPGGFTALITVPDNKYNPSTQVLIAGSGVDLASQAGKFFVTRGGSPAKNWCVGSNGKLTDDPAAIFDTISNDLIKAFESNMETTTVYQYNNNNLKGRLIFYKTSNGNYGVMLIADTPSIGTDVYNLKFKYKTYSKHDGTILKNGDTTVDGTYSFDLDTGTQSTSTAPLNDTKDFFLYASTYIAPQNGAKFYVLP